MNTTRPQKSPQTQGDPTRLMVLRVLHDIFAKKQTLEAAFGAHKANLNPRDMAFAYMLAAGVLRAALFLDACSRTYLKKPFPRESVENIILRMGLYQLLFMDGVKDHAAISTTVDLAKAAKVGHLAGVINAVLRQTQRADTPNFNAEDCLPHWFKAELKAYGDTFPALAYSMLEQAAVDVRTYGSPPPEGSIPLVGLKNAYRLPEGTIASGLEGLNTGGVYIQDMAAQWPATILAASVLAKNICAPVVDMCAAPGGKTLQLLDLLPNDILAVDVNHKRLKRLIENAAHLPRQPLTFAGDGLNPSLKEKTFGGVLLDAPCTATGTTRRHPEVLHLRQAADLEYLCDLQQKMLEKSAELLVSGGVLVYAVCSLFEKEGEAQNAWALKNLPLKPLAFDVPEPLKAAKLSPHTLRLTPQNGCDGFYIACYEKC